MLKTYKLVHFLFAASCMAEGSHAGRLAFVSQQSGRNLIYLVDLDGSGFASNPVRLTSDEQTENYPSWSPDGEWLTYQRDLDGSGIYVVRADGSDQQRLSPTPGFDVTPSWSPDGSKIIYARLNQAPQPNQPPMTQIRVVNADGTDDHAILVYTRFSVEPRLSINGQIVFMSLMGGAQLDIYTMNADGTNLRRLTSGEANSGDPVWSPDGLRISFGSDREGDGKLNVFSMDAGGSNVFQLTHFDVPLEAGDTSWSSDGATIAFERDVNGNKQSDPNAFAEVWTMNADGSEPVTTAIRCSSVGCSPRWRPEKCRDLSPEDRGKHARYSLRQDRL